MKSEKWETVRLKDLTTDGKGHYGIGAPAVEYKKNLYAYLRITDITDDGRINRDNLMSVDHPDAKKYLLKENDIVFARTGNSTGRSYFYDKRDGELVYAGFLIKFNLDPEKVNPKYIKLYTMTKEYKSWINSVATGSTRKNINAKMYGDMEIKLPPRQYQDYVVNTVEPLNEKIENNIQMIKTLERIAQVIYKHWFIDFEFPNENGEPYKSSGGEMIESELGKIPKKWDILKLGYLGEFKNGINYSRNEDGDKEYSIINVRDLVEGDFIIKNQLDKIRINSNKAESYKLLKGDLLIVRSANPGEMGIVLEDLENTIYSGFIIRFRLTEDSLLYYTYFALKSKKNKFAQYSDGTTLKNINQKMLKKINVIIPEKKVLEKFNQIVQPIFNKITLTNKENEYLKELRDLLLPKLMSGEIRVPIESE